MKQITPDEYCEGVESIYVKQPKYKTGGDGDDNECDCIGMGRGALKRKGVTDVKGMNGTNYALRHTFASVALQNGVDIRTVSGMLGHADPGSCHGM